MEKLDDIFMIRNECPDDDLPRLLLLCGRMKDDLMGVIRKVAEKIRLSFTPHSVEVKI